MSHALSTLRDGSRQAFQNRALKFALLSGILAATAAYFLLNYFLGQSYVLVATKKIEEGTVVSRENVALKRVPNSNLCPEALRTLDGVVGRRIRVTRFPGDQISKTLFSQDESSLSVADIPREHVLISICLSDSNLSSGIIREGDLVDIIAVSKSEVDREVEAKTVLRGVRILKASKNTTNSNSLAHSERQIIYFAVPLEEAEYLYALEARNAFKLALELGR